MAEDDFDRAEGGFEASRRRRGAGRGVGVAVEGVGVVADHLEGPEDRGGAAEVAGDLGVAAANEGGQAVEIGRVSDVRRR